MPVRTYRKLPVEIQAIQYHGLDNLEECFEFLGWDGHTSEIPMTKEGGFDIPTLEGKHICSVGDYIIRGVHGEFYPCKPDIFKKTYELV